MHPLPLLLLLRVVRRKQREGGRFPRVGGIDSMNLPVEASHSGTLTLGFEAYMDKSLS